MRGLTKLMNGRKWIPGGKKGTDARACARNSDMCTNEKCDALSSVRQAESKPITWRINLKYSLSHPPFKIGVLTPPPPWLIRPSCDQSGQGNSQTPQAESEPR